MNRWLMSPLSGRGLAREEHPLREIAQVFDDLWRGLPTSPMPAAGTALRLDVREDEKAFHVTADLPGMSEQDVEVTFRDNTLTIRGEKKIERDEKKDTWHLVERSYGSFARQLGFPPTVDADKIEAKFEKGVLTVILPKQPNGQAGGKKIEVKAG